VSDSHLGVFAIATIGHGKPTSSSSLLISMRWSNISRCSKMYVETRILAGRPCGCNHVTAGRQKMLGHRTHCIQYNLVQGQFCGDCLYMRYWENVLEAEQNPDWICPMPVNPDVFMPKCEACRELYHPVCLNMTNDQAKQLPVDNYTCGGCRSLDGSEGFASIDLSMTIRTSDPEELHEYDQYS
nr:cell division cycle-associated protein 7-like [Tanacetum cinerariifolium]